MVELVAANRGSIRVGRPGVDACDPANAVEPVSWGLIKSSYRQGGDHFAVKIASGFPKNLGRGMSVGNGMMLLSSAETGQPTALLADGGYLTDVRTAAVSALVARELGRDDIRIVLMGD